MLNAFKLRDFPTCESTIPRPLAHASGKPTVPGPLAHATGKAAVPGSLPHPAGEATVPCPLIYATILAIVLGQVRIIFLLRKDHTMYMMIKFVSWRPLILVNNGMAHWGAQC